MKRVPPRGNCWQFGLGLIFFVLLMLSVGLLVVGNRLHLDAQSVMQLPNYQLQNCTLLETRVNTCPKGGFVAVWKRKEGGENSVVQNPFALKQTQDLAERDTNDFPFNVTFPCWCDPNYMDPYPSLTCNFNDACMMDVPMGAYMKKVGGVYGYGGDTLLAIGSLTLIMGVVGIILVIIANGFCACCNGPKPSDDYVQTPL